LKQHRSRQIARKKIKTTYGLNKLHRNLVVHHKDGNPFNNELENLEIMTRSQHTGYHTNKYLESKPIEGLENLELLLNLYNNGF
jgi:hypothetical protein